MCCQYYNPHFARLTTQHSPYLYWLSTKDCMPNPTSNRQRLTALLTLQRTLLCAHGKLAVAHYFCTRRICCAKYQRLVCVAHSTGHLRDDFVTVNYFASTHVLMTLTELKTDTRKYLQHMFQRSEKQNKTNACWCSHQAHRLDTPIPHRGRLHLAPLRH